MTGTALRRARRSASAAVLTGGGLAAAWLVFARVQGDSEVVYDSDLVAAPAGDIPGRFLGEVRLANRGRQLAAVLRVAGRIVEGPPGTVLVTRQGTHPPEPGFWVSNLLAPGESCVAEVDIVVEGDADGPVVVELDAQEIGRRPVVHRRARFRIPSGGE